MAIARVAEPAERRVAGRLNQQPPPRWAATYDELACAVWLLDGDCRVIYANRAAARLLDIPPQTRGWTLHSLGWTVCDADGKPLPPERYPSVVAARTGQAQREQIAGIRSPQGLLRWLLVECLPRVDHSGRTMVVVTAQEVTGWKQAEIALRASEERYRRIVETTHEGLCLLDRESRIQFVNARLCALLDYGPEELIGRRSFDIFDQGSGPLLGGPRSGAARDRDVALRRKDGSVVWAMVSAAPMLDDDGQPSNVLAMLTDVTDRKLSEERVREAAAQIERLTADAIYTLGPDGLVRSWNHGAERLFGWTSDEAIGRRIGMVPPEMEDRVRVGLEHILATGETITKETVRMTKSGASLSVLGSWSRTPLPGGGAGVLCILKDISEHKAAHTQLRDQAKSLALLRERERIAMDLHDGVIQSLYGIALSLGALRRLQRGKPEEATVLGHVISQLTETIQGIRGYISELRTGVPDGADLVTGLKAKAAELAATTGVYPRLSIQADPGRMDADRAQHLSYILHEALSNVARHAHATDVAIEILPWRSGIMLTISDNGCGFEPGRRGRRAGDGLHNMRERAALLGAKLVVDSQPGVGTTVRVRVR